MKVVEIEIVGRRYALQSDRPPEHVRAVAAYVDGKLRELVDGRVSAVQRDHAILAALNIASELFLMQEQREELLGRVGATVDEVVARIDRAAQRLPGPAEPSAHP